MKPDHLYKYVAFRSEDEKTQQRLHALLITPKLWFSEPSSFNDPMDCNPRFRFEGGMLEERQKLRQTILKRMIRENHGELSGRDVEALLDLYQRSFPALDDRLLEIGHQLLAKDLQSDVGVLCLSECGCDPVMFYHYGDKHRGMCLQFRTADYFSYAEPVQYSEEYPSIQYFDSSANEKQFEQIFLTKYSGWKYEHEQRVINFEQHKTPRLCEYPPKLLEGVIFGYLMPEEDRLQVVRLLEQRGHTVQIYVAEVSRDHYLLDINDGGQVSPDN